MPIEWAIVKVAVLPFLKKYAQENAQKLAGKIAEAKLSQIYATVTGNDSLSKANEAFVLRFNRELESCMDLDTLFAESYASALKTFLTNSAVQSYLHLPLAGEDLDWTILRGIWSEIRDSGGKQLILLPADFNWSKVAKNYRDSIRKLALTDPELRPLFQTLAAMRIEEQTKIAADSVQRIVGPVLHFDFARYAESIRTAFGYLKLGSVDAEWTDYERKVRLDSVYVPQSVKQAIPSRDLTRDYRELLEKEGRNVLTQENVALLELRKQQYAQVSALPLLEVISNISNTNLRRLVILGDPGLGKSTLLRHLLLRWSEDVSKPLTMLIEVRRANRAAGYQTFLDYMEKGAGALENLPRLELHEHLRTSESLVLFDGLDEIPAGSRADTVSDIIHFATEYPRARIIVTTRVHGYATGSDHPETFRNAGFEQFTLQDFGEVEIDRFLRVWHQEAFTDLTDRVRYETRIRKALEDSPAIRELATNPLLLTLMAVLSRNQDLPRDRGKLYERCADLLLKNWDLEKFPELKNRGRARQVTDRLGPDQKMRILEQVAATIQQERTGLEGNMISENRLKEKVEGELKQLGLPEPWSVADDLISMLRERNFMLAYMGDHQYAFIHRTFLEYFYARALKFRLERTSSLSVQDLRQIFSKRWAEDEWHEILKLLCGMIGAEYAGQCVSELLLQERRRDGHRAVLVAAQCLQEVREFGIVRSVRSAVRERLIHLIHPDSSSYNQPWVDERGEFVPVPDWQLSVAALQELARGWKDDPGTLLWLKGRADRDKDWMLRQAAVQELARGWKDDPDTLLWLKDRADRNEDWILRQAAVQELARGWKDDPDTLPLLKRSATAEHSELRRTAVQELARGWKDDPDTLPLVKRSAIELNSMLRRTAVQELARGWKDDPDTFPLVRDRVSPDEDRDVRRAALQELTRNWRDHPDTLPLVKGLVCHDEDKLLGLAALEELTRNWRDHPDTLPLVKDLLRHDNSVVRAAALENLALNWRDHPDTLPLVKGLICRDEDDIVRKLALHELARNWRDHPDTLPLIKDLIRHEDNIVRGAALRELGRGWEDDPDTVASLRDRAAHDANRLVRQDALRELADGWKDDPDIVALLKDRAANDEDADVRQLAIGWLAEDRKDDSTILSLLTDRATRDEDEGVRQNVIHSLARGWRDDPGTLPLLKNRATHDKSGYVRRVATSWLMEHWEQDPDTLSLLKDRATRDENEDVRRWAIQLLARRWGHDPSTLPLLKDRANQDVGRAQRAAIEELARAWKHDPDVQKLLMELSSSREGDVWWLRGIISPDVGFWET